MNDLLEHLSSGCTTVARAWDVRRRDGLRLGFTDHDLDLTFDGLVFRAGSGLSAGALVQVTGLAVDNAEALGALSDAALSEADIAAGRWDGAEVTAWLVNWSDPEQRLRRFTGRIGDIRQGSGAFRAELRGLTDLLNQPGGRTYHRDCPAILGDRACRVDRELPSLSFTREVLAVPDERTLVLGDLNLVAPRWFERGELRVIDGRSAGLTTVVKHDPGPTGGLRAVALWVPMAGPIAVGDRIWIAAGCDKRIETCRTKFSNIRNFRGFPHIPGEDWLAAVPRGSDDADGGSRLG